jgi:hypothetical protein
LFYAITTEYGVLETKYRAFDLEKYFGELNIDISKITKKITLREVCRQFNKRVVKVDKASIFCKCSGKCFNDKRCNCFKNKKFSFSYSYEIFIFFFSLSIRFYLTCIILLFLYYSYIILLFIYLSYIRILYISGLVSLVITYHDS